MDPEGEGEGLKDIALGCLVGWFRVGMCDGMKGNIPLNRRIPWCGELTTKNRARRLGSEGRGNLGGATMVRKVKIFGRGELTP